MECGCGVAASNRSAVYFMVAVIVAGLVDRERRLRSRVRRQKQQLDELQSIREALTPADVPDRPGLDVAAAFLPAEGPVAALAFAELALCGCQRPTGRGRLFDAPKQHDRFPPVGSLGGIERGLASELIRTHIGM